MRDESDIPSCERETARWRIDRLPAQAVRLGHGPLPWSRREIAMGAAAAICAVVAAIVVVVGMLPLVGGR